MKKRILRNIEWGILVCTVLLIIIGVIALFSSTQNSDYDELKKQIMWLAISVPVMIVVILIDYEFFAKISPVFYGISIVLLIGVLFTADVIVKIQRKGKNEMNRFLKLSLIILTVAVPVLLIIKQPDYGTALAFFFALIFMLFVAGVDKKYIITAILLVVIIVPVAYFFILPEHAKTRIDVYLNPDLDPRGAGYNIIQSKLAIGAGQILGMGLLKGNQTQLGYLYPKTTDFIFAVIGEEMGFIVAGAVIILYVVLITKAIYVAKTAKNDLGSYIAAGIAGIFFFHMMENIGMTMGLLPITGIPLPFVSYGGSSMLTNCILIAILLNISGRRQKAMFRE